MKGNGIKSIIVEANSSTGRAYTARYYESSETGTLYGAIRWDGESRDRVIAHSLFENFRDLLDWAQDRQPKRSETINRVEIEYDEKGGAK